MVARRAHIVQGRGEMSDHIPGIPTTIVIDCSQHVQCCQSPVDEAPKGVQFRWFTQQEVTAFVGLSLMHGSHTPAVQFERHESDGSNSRNTVGRCGNVTAEGDEVLALGIDGFGHHPGRIILTTKDTNPAQQPDQSGCGLAICSTSLATHVIKAI
jgi:hypothetical protein